MSSLLAVDLGVKMGLALYNHEGRLVWYRSQNFGNVARLRKGAAPILKDLPELGALVVEGDRLLGEVWARAAQKRAVYAEHPAPKVMKIGAEVWRTRLLHPRHQRSGAEAKRHADTVAHEVIAWSGAKRPTGPLRHDAAEAILIGLWGVLEMGWLSAWPPSS